MGVPGFFSWLLRQYKKNSIILKELPDKTTIDILYIDANCLVHPQCFKLLEFYPKWKKMGEEWLHNKMMDRIINYIKYIVNTVKPNKVFIAIDGVAPMAKMSQQRLRRYRAIDSLEEKEALKKKYNMDIPDRWTNTVITPGTVFMENLHNRILKYIKSQKDIKIYYSSYKSRGEGEHKILEHLKNQESNKKYVVYGLDADLIFLTWCSKKPGIYLLRETQQLGKYAKSNNNKEIVDPILDVSQDLNYVDIDEMKHCYFSKISKEVKLFKEIEFSKIIDDFIIICFLLGNDFLPHIPSIDINIGGLDILLESYVKTINTLHEYLYENQLINITFLENMLKILANKESFYFSKVKKDFMENCKKRKCHFTEPYDIEIWKKDNLVDENKEDYLKLGIGKPYEWKYRYYNYHYNVNDISELINNLCFEYFKGIIWNGKYYFDKCKSWSWKYPYLHGPFVSDLYKYIKNCKFDINKINIKDNGSLYPCQQLLAVLPPKCSYLLPNNYKYLTTKEESPIIDLYPKRIKVDKYGQYKDFKCIPLIPLVNQNYIIDATKNIKLEKSEQVRNKNEKLYQN